MMADEFLFPSETEARQAPAAPSEEFMFPSEIEAGRKPTAGSLAKQVGVGAIEGVTGMVGGLADVLNPMGIARSVHSLLSPDELREAKKAGATPQELTQQRFGTSATTGLNTALGSVGLNPEDYPAENFPERIARGVGTGITGAAIPGGGARTLGTVAGDVLTGGIAGASGALAQEVAPEPLKPVAGLAGAVLGGGAAGTAQALGSTVARKGAEFFRPALAASEKYGTKTAEQMAAEKYASHAENLEDAKHQLAAAAAGHEIVPTSPATTGQVTADTGLLSLERGLETRHENTPKFGAIRERQNEARRAAMEGIQATGAPDVVADTVRANRQAIDRMTQAAVDNAATEAADRLGTIGGTATPEAYGAAIREAVDGAERAGKARTRALWQAVDPDGTLALDVNPLSAAARRATEGMTASARPMAGEEAAIFDVAANYGKVMPFREVTDLRSRVSAAMRDELWQNGSTPTYARLAQLRGAIENTIDTAVERQATAEAQVVAQGRLSPRDTMVARLDDWASRQSAEQGALGQGAGVAHGRAENVGTGSAAIPVAPGTGGAAGTRPGNAGGGLGISGAPGAGAAGTVETLAPNLNAGAAQRLKTASAATREQKQTFGPKPIGPILQRQSQSGPFNVADADVARRIFHPGDRGAQDVEALRRAVGDDTAIPILTDYAASSLRQKAMRPDGLLDIRKFEQWQHDHANALRALPDTVRENFADVARASDAIEGVAALRHDALARYDKDALGQLLNVRAPEDVTRTIGSIFTRRDRVHAMREIVRETQGNPAAMEGLRRAVVEHLGAKAVSDIEVGTSGVAGIKPAVFQKFVRENQAVLSQVLSRDEMNTLNAIGMDINRTRLSVNVPRPPASPGTAHDIRAAEAAGHGHGSPFTAVIAGLAAHHVGGLMAGIATGVGAKIASAFRDAGLNRVDKIVTKMALEPDFAHLMLAKLKPATADNTWARLGARLQRSAVVGATEAERSPTRAHGGRIERRAVGGGMNAPINPLQPQPAIPPAPGTSTNYPVMPQGPGLPQLTNQLQGGVGPAPMPGQPASMMPRPPVPGLAPSPGVPSAPTATPMLPPRISPGLAPAPQQMPQVPAPMPMQQPVLYGTGHFKAGGRTKTAHVPLPRKARVAAILERHGYREARASGGRIVRFDDGGTVDDSPQLDRIPATPLPTDYPALNQAVESGARSLGAEQQPDPQDFTAKYNTALPPQAEQQFLAWSAAQSQATGRNVQNDIYDYDLRGWWQQNPNANLTGAHLTDTFKKPNHPTFSTGSQYHGVDGNEGGVWGKQADGSWTFTPGKTNIQMFSPDEMQDYFRKVEPGNKLVLPQYREARASGGRIVRFDDGGTVDDSPQLERIPATPLPTDYPALNQAVESGARSFIEPGIDLGGTLQRAYQGLPTRPMDYIGPMAAAAANVIPGERGAMTAVKGAEALTPEAETAAQKLIQAYHGSPHDFDRFDISRIGTGEGAQAYGHGLYFAENEGVARSYRDALADPQAVPLHFKGRPIDDVWTDGILDRWSDVVKGMKPNKVDDFTTIMSNLTQVKDLDQVKHVLAGFTPDQRKMYDSMIKPELTKPDVPPGRMYQVAIKADPDHFLHWDKPLSEQSEYVKKALQPWRDKELSAIGKARFAERDSGEPPRVMALRKSLEDGSITGSGLYNLQVGSKSASEQLRDAGIPGIKYLDQGSRGKGEGSHNYVVFEDKTIDILKKYGIAGLGAGLGAKAATSQGNASP